MSRFKTRTPGSFIFKAYLGKGTGFLVGNVDGWWGRVLGWLIMLWLFSTLGWGRETLARNCEGGWGPGATMLLSALQDARLSSWSKVGLLTGGPGPPSSIPGGARRPSCLAWKVLLLAFKLTQSRLLRRRKKTKPEQIQAVWRASPAPPRWSPWSWTYTSPGTLEHQTESQKTEVHGDALHQLLLHGCDCGFLLQLLLVSMMPSCCEALVPRKRVFKTNVFQNHKDHLNRKRSMSKGGEMCSVLGFKPCG